MSIKKFKKKETNRKKIIKILSAFMIVGIVLSGTSYAVYQRESEVTFILKLYSKWFKSNNNM